MRYRIAMTVAALLMIGGAVLVFGVDTHSKKLDPTAGNPVPSTTESVERGRMLFQQNCIQCHGVDGRGDGPEAERLNPKPTDFRQHIPLHDDQRFFNFIANGYPMSEMPKFRSAFSDTDIWNLVNFLRFEFSEEPTE